MRVFRMPTTSSTIEIINHETVIDVKSTVLQIMTHNYWWHDKIENIFQLTKVVYLQTWQSNIEWVFYLAKGAKM